MTDGLNVIVRGMVVYGILSQEWRDKVRGVMAGSEHAMRVESLRQGIEYRLLLTENRLRGTIIE